MLSDFRFTTDARYRNRLSRCVHCSFFTGSLVWGNQISAEYNSVLRKGASDMVSSYKNIQFNQMICTFAWGHIYLAFCTSMRRCTDMAALFPRYAGKNTVPPKYEVHYTTKMHQSGQLREARRMGSRPCYARSGVSRDYISCIYYIDIVG